MSKAIVGMTISLDGFVADKSGGVGRLYSDLGDLQGSAYVNAAIEETGAVLMGRRAFEMGEPDSFVVKPAKGLSRTGNGDFLGR
jgi:hypothetical protein